MVDKLTGEIVFPFVRSPFNYDVDEVSDRTGLRCEDESRAQQHFLEEVDINTIVKRFGLTGELPEPDSVKVPLEGDFEAVYDFQSAMNVVRAAEESFMAMPAEVRSEFGNDPARFMAFVHDPDNRARAEKLGLIVPRETPTAPEPMVVRVVADKPEVSGGGTSST